MKIPIQELLKVVVNVTVSAAVAFGVAKYTVRQDFDIERFSKVVEFQRLVHRLLRVDFMVLQKLELGEATPKDAQTAYTDVVKNFITVSRKHYPKYVPYLDQSARTNIERHFAKVEKELSVLERKFEQFRQANQGIDPKELDLSGPREWLTRLASVLEQAMVDTKGIVDSEVRRLRQTIR